MTERTIYNATDSKERFDAKARLQYKNLTLSANHSDRYYTGGSIEDGLAYSMLQNNTKLSNTNIRLNYIANMQSTEVDTSLNYGVTKFTSHGYKGTKNDHDNYSGVILGERKFRFTSDLKKTFSKKNRIVTGIDMRTMKVSADKVLGNFDSSGSHIGEFLKLHSTTAGPRQSQVGFYFQTQNKFNKYISLTSGIRYDYDSISESDINPRVALVSKFNKDFTTKLIYGEAFRPPGYGELFQDVATVQGNKNLKSEKIKTYEASIIKTLKKQRIQATYYISFLTNEIEGYFDSGVVRFRNKDKSRREGLEIELFNHLTDALSVRSTFSKSYKLDETISLMSDHMTMASMAINYKLNKVNISLSGIYKEKFPNIEQDSVFKFNTKVEYQYDQDISIFLIGNNITNKEYLNTTFVRTNNHTNRGRLYSLGTKINF